jgi:isopentenyl phosphate kinase
MKNITLIKLGGSIITNKEVPMMVRRDVLDQLVLEIYKVRKNTDDLFIIGHGQGSFAHAPALRYKTKEGFISDDSVIGMAITQDSAAQLNRIVVNNFIRHQIPAASFLFSNSMVTKDMKALHWCKDVLVQYLKKGLVPVTCGDVIVDEKKGCTIWSTEKILSYIAQNMPTDQYRVNRVIHVTEVEGVLDGDNNIVEEISRDNQNDIKKMMRDTKGFDVTGGMWHKIEESLELADQGIQSVIISGMNKNNLLNCLSNKEFIGTKIILKR